MLWHLEKCTVPCFRGVRTAFDGASKRGCPRPGRTTPRQEGGRQLCLEESFSRKDIVTPEVLRKTCTRWFIDTMMPLSLIDHPTTGHFFSLLAPEFSAPSRGTLGGENRPGLRHRQVGPLQYAVDTSYVATTADAGRRTTGLHWHDVPLDRPGSPPPTWHIGVQGDQGN
ncbi:hypothetical protein GWK47_052222 [Chionoecetes opilio]|uniref:Uncharacterized protein n=1 Tax=Chionoecetes opilio TaxID=41210 RepID=A0A8J4Y899_CHIOP|nr:hypothetical protein GWK47_052222 [Chionoecetes opilio]